MGSVDGSLLTQAFVELDRVVEGFLVEFFWFSVSLF